MKQSVVLRAILLVVGLLALLLIRPPSDPAGAFQSALCRSDDAHCQRVEHAWIEENRQAPMLVSLPHAVTDAGGQPLTYQLLLRVPPSATASADLGMCLPRAPLIERVELDGRGVALSSSQPTHAFLRPLHVRLGRAVTPGVYQLTLRVLAPPGLLPGLGTFWVGDDDLMTETCGELAGVLRNRTHGVTWVMAAIGLAGLLLWFRLRDLQSLWFGLTTLAWVIHLWVVSSAPASLSAQTWSLLFVATRGLFVTPLLLYVGEVLELESRGWKIGFAALFVGGTVLLLLLPTVLYPSWLIGMALLYLPVVVGLLFLIARKALNTESVQPALMGVALGLVILAHAIDISRWWSVAGFGTRAWSYLAVPLLCVVFGARMLESLIAHARREANEAQRLRREVEAQRVRIAADYERLQQQREQLAVLQERRRIVRDMHDGLGAQLLSASARLKSREPIQPDRIAAYFDEALQELRTVLDVLSVEPSQNPDDDPVASLLGMLRWRMAPAMSARGMSLRWHCDALPSDFLSDDASRMHLIRLLQEAFSNVLKHSSAKDVIFEARLEVTGVLMRLKDDGRGFEPGERRGIGLDSMRARASAIGAELTLRSASGQGTEVVLRWYRRESTRAMQLSSTAGAVLRAN